jgi:hypothetical protein
MAPMPASAYPRGGEGVPVTWEVLGREAELAMLRAFLDRLQDGPGALVLAGDAGARKTTLLHAGAEFAAARGFTVVQAQPARSELPLAFAGDVSVIRLLMSGFQGGQCGLLRPAAAGGRRTERGFER